MRPSIKAEIRKLLTTRTLSWLLLAMLIFAGPGVLLSGESDVGQLSRPLQEHLWFFIAAGFTRLFVVVLGIKSVTDEYAHGTIVPSLLASPDRRRLLAAKAITIGAAGLVLTLVAETVMIGVASLYVTTRGADLTITSATIRALGGMAAAGSLWAVIGVAIGAIVRWQIPAIVGSLIWLLPGGGLEDVIRNMLESSSSAQGGPAMYLPGNGGMALALAPNQRALWWGALVLSGYVVVLLAVGAWLMQRRDIAP